MVYGISDTYYLFIILQTQNYSQCHVLLFIYYNKSWMLEEEWLVYTDSLKLPVAEG